MISSGSFHPKNMGLWSKIYDSLIHIISTERQYFNKNEQQAFELLIVKEYEKDTKGIRKKKLTAVESCGRYHFFII